MPRCIKAAMNMHMIEFGLGAIKVFQICTGLVAWKDSFEVVDGVGSRSRFVLFRPFEGERNNLNSVIPYQ